MDSEILKGFIEETESYLPIIRGGILLCSQEKNKNSKEELQVSINQAHTIKGAASVIGLDEVKEIAEELEKDLKSFSENEEPFSDEQSRESLDLLVKLEALISELKFGIDEFEIDASNLVEESFENFQSGEYTQDDFASDDSEEDSFEDFEIDDEMIEIFAMEAEDHLRNINQNLEVLEQDSNNREALLEIRRSSHTLKGSAGIVGLKQLSKLAHRMEDLLDYISDNQIESNEEIFHLLLASTDCLNDITNGEKSDELNDKINHLHKKFDVLLEQLQNPNNTEKEVTKVEETPTEEPKKEKSLVKSEVERTVPTSSQPRSIIRVSLEKLDDLVRLVSEMVFSRSVFEQRLVELEKQIEELQLTTRRLQRSTGKLETDFEAGMLGNVSYGNAKNFVPNRLDLFADTSANQLDTLEFDTLEFDRYTDFHQTTRELLESTSDTFAINSELDTLYSFLELLFDNQKRLIDEMQDKLLSLRMVSFGTLTARLQRTVRVTAEEEEKLVDLSILGENIEVDTQILDSLVEPLLHLLRNAVAHGVEPPETRRLLGKNEKGKINLKVYSEGTHIILTITDDGRGISKNSLKEKALSLGLITQEESEKMTDEEALALIFLPGLTTAEEISQVAGRGVGMNIVKANIQRQQGTISIDSTPQIGTTFIIRIPMALAVTRSLLVKAHGQKFAFPLKLVKHISEISPDNLEKARKDKNIRLGDVNYKVAHLNELLGLPIPNNTYENDIPLLLLHTVKKPCALIVDKIIKPEEVVIKPLGNLLQDLPDLLGATILGDGSVVPVLDLVYLLDEYKPEVKQIKPTVPEKENPQINVLIVDDSPSVRHINSKLVKNNGWNPIVAKDGLEALELLQSTSQLPDVILTDVEMPQMDGYELLASLKRNKKLKSIPVVMITSRAGDKHRRKAFDLGVSEYLTKPYEDSKLIEFIQKLSS